MVHTTRGVRSGSCDRTARRRGLSKWTHDKFSTSSLRQQFRDRAGGSNGREPGAGFAIGSKPIQGIAATEEKIAMTPRWRRQWQSCSGCRTSNVDDGAVHAQKQARRSLARTTARSCRASRTSSSAAAAGRIVRGEYGPSATVDNRFNRWSRRRLLDPHAGGPGQGRPDIRRGCRPRLDLRQSPARRPRRKRGSREQAIGPSRAGPTTKIHVLTDVIGPPGRHPPHPGNTSDVKTPPPCWKRRPAGVRRLIADKGYDAD